MSTYNGWPNYETWSVNLWGSNDPYTDEMTRQIAQEAPNVYAAADALKSYFEDLCAEEYTEGTLTSQLLGYALCRVDWVCLAEHWRDER